MKHFVIHYPKLKERKEFLIEHLKERGVNDVEWVEGYNMDDPFVNWLSNKVNNKMPMGHFSGFVKHLIVLKQMVDRNIREAIVCEDDVLFHKDYHLIKFPPNLMFVKLGIGVNFHLEPGIHPVMVGNLGGNEANYITLEFARQFLNEIHFGHSSDIVYQAFLAHRDYPLVCIPVAHQTSLLDGQSVCGGSEMPNWINYIKNWRNYSKYSWNQILDDYKNVTHAEDFFEKNFGKRIKITNCEYIQIVKVNFSI